MEATIVYADALGSSADYMAIVSAIGDALARANLIHCRAGRLPHLYRSGIGYRDLPGQRWRDGLTIWADPRHVAQCVELAAWRVAELWCAGKPAKVGVVQTGPTLYHAVVADRHGRKLEDPSEELR